jgi:hypothetical protein
MRGLIAVSPLLRPNEAGSCVAAGARPQGAGPATQEADLGTFAELPRSRLDRAAPVGPGEAFVVIEAEQIGHRAHPYCVSMLGTVYKL